ncbi:MAG TPA: DUF3667 domain-containing protein [Telluria sp.]
MTSSHAHHDDRRYCLNCSAAVDYHYCAVCGQETKLHVPSASEFIHEFIGHYVALEGRLWKTLAFLMFKPGFLSAEYIAGRRVRYVEPLRVYLTFSILFFALLKVVGAPVMHFNGPVVRAPHVAQKASVPKESVSIIQLEPGEKMPVFSSVPGIGPKLTAFLNKPSPEQIKTLAGGFFAYVPYAMFCLMPLFALYLKLLYLGSGRRYGEHLLFALHTNAFAFAMFSLMIVAVALNLEFIVFLMMLWTIAYLPLAMRRVYRGSRWATGLRWAVLVFAHVISMISAIVTALGFTILS